MKFDISKVTRLFSKMGRAIKHAGPEIAIISGTVGLVTAGVIACTKTPKAIEIIEQHKKDMDILAEANEKGAMANGEPYPVEQYKQDKITVCTQTGLKFLKVYAIPLTLAAVSVVSILSGGKVFRQRLTSLGAAYALLEQNFGKYRDGVIEKFGKDIDDELRFGTKTELVEKEVIDENGNKKTELEEVKTTTYDGHSDYARFFDESSIYWEKDGGRNLAFVQQVQAWCNDQLRNEGVLFLNDVYKQLGIARTEAGQHVGWVWDPNNDKIDRYVDFGITDILTDKARVKEFMTDRERTLLLDFNCDGRIDREFEKFEKIPCIKRF